MLFYIYIFLTTNIEFGYQLFDTAIKLTSLTDFQFQFFFHSHHGFAEKKKHSRVKGSRHVGVVHSDAQEVDGRHVVLFVGVNSLKRTR